MSGMEAETGNAHAWVRAHADVLGVARERAGLEAREGACLLQASREDVHRHLGYGTFPEYSDRYLGYGHRTTQDKLRTAEALERLPELARALQEGKLHVSAVRELARVATPETEVDWIEAAGGRRMREIERLVVGRARGDRPSDVPRPEIERHVLRFEVSGETLAAFREATGLLRERSGEALDDDTILLMLARSVLCGGATQPDTDAPTPTAPGRPKYQIRITACDHCKRGFQHAGADLVEIDRAMLDAARCDASIRTDTPAKIETHVGRVGEPDRAPKTGSSPEVSAPLGAARTRTIPPAVRRRVLEHDQHRCRIPGCRNTHDLEVHHIVPRADGGTDDPDDLVTICGGHHRAVHAGRLLLSGTASELRVRHADGSPYGPAITADAAANAATAEKVFGGLRGLGYKETEAKRALARALAEQPSGTELTDKVLLRSALMLLGASPRRG